MQVYEFALCSASDGVPATTEQLGYLALAGDSDAIAFATPIAEELAQGDGEFGGWAVKITAGERHVSSIPVQSIERKRRVA